jgi:hypothetical protein
MRKLGLALHNCQVHRRRVDYSVAWKQSRAQSARHRHSHLSPKTSQQAVDFRLYRAAQMHQRHSNHRRH